VRRALILAVVLLWATQAAAQVTLYVRDGASGTCTTSWSNACDEISTAEALINRAANGAYTIYVADGTYSGVTFNATASGTTTVTVTKATASEHGTETGWSSTFGDGQAVTGNWIIDTAYWTFDGNGTNLSAWGFKINSPLTETGTSIAVNIRNSPAEINLSHIHSEVTPAGANKNVGVRIASTGSSYTWSNIRVTGVGDDAIKVAGSGHLLEYIWVDGRNTVATIHGDAFAFSSTQGDASTLRYSIIDWLGAHIWFDGTGSNPRHGPWHIYGNVHFGGPTAGGKVMDDHSNTLAVELYYHHNSIIDMDVFSTVGITSGEVKNNIIYGNDASFGFGSASHDYNAFGPGVSTSGETNAQVLSSIPFTDWESGDFTLTGATNCGVPLATTYDTDVVGNGRGEDGCWDRGAYEYTGAPAAVNITTTTMNAAVTGVAYNAVQLQRTGGVAPFTWGNNSAGTSLNDADADCAGLSVSTSGLVTGTPTASTSTCTWTASITDGSAGSDTQLLTIAIPAPPPPVGDGDASDTFDCVGTCALSANWTHQTSQQISLSGNEATSTATQTPHFAFYDAEAFDPNQRSCITITSTPGSNTWHYAGVRMSATGDSLNAYVITAEDGFSIAAKFINGTRTQLGSTISGVAWVDGDQLCLDASGSTLKAYRNLQQIGDAGGIATGGELSSGQPGFGLWNSATADSWQGFNLDVVAPPNQAPIAAWVTPTSSNTYSTEATTLDIAGTCTDNDGSVASVTVTNNTVSVGAIGGPTTWSKSGITLVLGLNRLIVTCTDDDNASSIAQLDVTRTTTEVGAAVKRRLRVR
jgi:hypothetical protein